MHASARALFRSVVVGLALAGLSAGAAAQQKFVNILTGGQSGVYYPLGVALGQIYGKALPDTKTSVQATKASVENLNLLQAGRGELAFTLGDSLSDAWKGDEEAGFKTPLNKLRTEKNQLDQKLADLLRNGTALAGGHRDLHALTLQLHEQLQPLVGDVKSLPAIPELDAKLLEAFEQPADSNPKRPAR